MTVSAPWAYSALAWLTRQPLILGYVVGEAAQFRFFSSVVRKQDKPGDVLERVSDNEIAETDSLQTTLPRAKGV